MPNYAFSERFAPAYKHGPTHRQRHLDQIGARRPGRPIFEKERIMILVQARPWQIDDSCTAVYKEQAGVVDPSVSEIAFIDSGVSCCYDLVRELCHGVQGIILEPTRDALGQIAAVLVGRRSLRAIHIIAQGAAGEVSFGSRTLSLEGYDTASPQTVLDLLSRPADNSL
jgi:hypothetical protein